MPLNNKKCSEISEDKITLCEKTAGLWSGALDLNSASFKELVPIKNISDITL